MVVTKIAGKSVCEHDKAIILSELKKAMKSTQKANAASLPVIRKVSDSPKFECIDREKSYWLGFFTGLRREYANDRSTKWDPVVKRAVRAIKPLLKSTYNGSYKFSAEEVGDIWHQFESKIDIKISEAIRANATEIRKEFQGQLENVQMQVTDINEKNEVREVEVKELREKLEREMKKTQSLEQDQLELHVKLAHQAFVSEFDHKELKKKFGDLEKKQAQLQKEIDSKKSAERVPHDIQNQNVFNIFDQTHFLI